MANSSGRGQVSHISKVKVYVRDLAAFADACQSLGLQFVEGQKTFRTYNGARGVCEHAAIVPGQPKAYEIGLIRGSVNESGEFEKNAGGDCFELNFDEWSGGYGMVAKAGAGCGLLLQEYACKTVEATAKKNGYELKRTKSADGSWRYEATRKVASAFAARTY